MRVLERVDPPLMGRADAGFESLTAIRDLWKGADRKISETTFNVSARGAVMPRARGR